VRHVVWDWNGTLFDDLPVVVDAVNACLRWRGADPIDVETYRRRFVRPLHRFYEDLLGVPVEAGDMAELDEVFQAAYRDGFDRVELHAESRAAVEAVAARGATQSIASMLWHELLVPTVRRFGLDDRMLAVDGHRGLAGDTKERHMVEHVRRLRQLFPGLDDVPMTVVGDIVDDADAARAARIGCVLFDGGSQSRARLESRGVPVADSLLDAVGLALGGTGQARSKT